MSEQKTVVVVGAGLGGLTTAYRLKQAGFNVTVLEKLSAVSGRTRSVNVGNCITDLGATVVAGSYDQTLALIDELGISDQLEVIDSSFAVPRNGELHFISLTNPVKSILTTKLLSWRAKLSMAKLALTLVPLRNKFNFYDITKAEGYDTETLEEYCDGRFPFEVYDYFLNPMLKFLYLHSGNTGSSLELLWWMNAMMTTAPSRAFKYGMSTLTETLAKDLDVRCGADVVSVIENDAAVQIKVSDERGEQLTIDADYCVVTPPLPIVGNICPQLESSQNFLATRQYDKVTVVSFFTSKRPDIDTLMIEIPDSQNSDLATILFQHNIASTRAPKGKGIVNAYFMNEWSEQYFGKDDQSIMQAAQAVVRAYVSEVDELDDFYVQQWQHTAAQSEVGYCKKLEDYLAQRNPQSRLHVIGDFLAGASLNVAVTTGNRLATEISRECSKIDNSFDPISTQKRC